MQTMDKTAMTAIGVSVAFVLGMTALIEAILNGWINPYILPLVLAIGGFVTLFVMLFRSPSDHSRS